ncbi:MAG: ABC transporter ATP-binding protein [Actinomycetaceae bacterium]|nr:ABC transporter ATP-binding protein [Actinomycetaceae bacterium]
MRPAAGPIASLNNVAVRDLFTANTAIKPGITAITGASGSGKSTILRMIAGFADPDAGHIEVHGHRLDSLNPVAHRRRVILMTQSPWVGQATVRESLGILGAWRNEKPPTDDMMRGALKALGFIHGLDTEVRTLSGGEQQRLAAARLTLARPQLALLDEPTAALDEVGARTFLTTLLRQLRNLGADVILVIHDERLLDLADHHLILADGKLFHAGSQSYAEGVGEPSGAGAVGVGEPSEDS